MGQSLSHRLAVTADPSRPWPDRPIAVALVITDLDVGGAERALVALAARLESKAMASQAFSAWGGQAGWSRSCARRMCPVNA